MDQFRGRVEEPGLEVTELSREVRVTSRWRDTQIAVVLTPAQAIARAKELYAAAVAAQKRDGEASPDPATLPHVASVGDSFEVHGVGGNRVRAYRDGHNEVALRATYAGEHVEVALDPPKALALGLALIAVAQAAEARAEIEQEAAEAAAKAKMAVYEKYGITP